jgi:mycothiol synthase
MTTTTDTELVLDGAPDIPGLRFRRLRADDATEYAALAEIVGAANAADGIPWRPTANHLRDEMAASVGMDIASDVVVAEVDGRAVAIGEVERVVREEVAVYDVWGNVHPGFRRRGLGRALLAANIRRAVERAALEPADQAVELRSFVEESEAGHLALMTETGFEPIRWFFLMRRDLSEPIPSMDLPEGLELRPVLPEHHRAIFDAEVEAFRDHWGNREKTDNDFELTHKTEELDTSLWVVAWDGDEIAGVVQNWIWPTENAELGVERGWLEHISVRRPWRRRGLARAITAESLRRLRDRGMTDAMLGVDADNPNGALGLYEGLGFTVDKRSSVYRRALPRG